MSGFEVWYICTDASVADVTKVLQSLPGASGEDDGVDVKITLADGRSLGVSSYLPTGDALEFEQCYGLGSPYTEIDVWDPTAQLPLELFSLLAQRLPSRMYVYNDVYVEPVAYHYQRDGLWVTWVGRDLMLGLANASRARPVTLRELVDSFIAYDDPNQRSPVTAVPWPVEAGPAAVRLADILVSSGLWQPVDIADDGATPWDVDGYAQRHDRDDPDRIRLTETGMAAVRDRRRGHDLGFIATPLLHSIPEHELTPEELGRRMARAHDRFTR